MKVFITGGTGFLGSHLANTLTERGIESTFIGRNEKLGRAYESKLAKFEKCDTNDEKRVQELMKGHTHVIHSAAFTSPWGRPEDFKSANLDATISLLKVAKANNVERFLQISTPSVYATNYARFSIRESEPLQKTFLNDYALTKYQAELEVLKAEKEGLFTVRFRPQGIFGPGDQAVFPRIISTAKRGFIPVVGDGSNMIDISYVANVVDGVLTALDTSNAIRGKVYNLSNDEPISNYGVIRDVLGRLGIPYKEKRLPFAVAYALGGAMEFISRNFQNYREPILTRYMAATLALTRTLNIEEAKRDLNYKPKVSMAEGLDRFIHWWKAKESGNV